MIKWSELHLAINGGLDMGFSNADKEWTLASLHEYRETGEMKATVFLRSGFPHEEEHEPDTWGPKSPEEVDWSGFDEEYNKTFADRLEHFPRGTVVTVDGKRAIVLTYEVRRALYQVKLDDGQRVSGKNLMYGVPASKVVKVE